MLNIKVKIAFCGLMFTGEKDGKPSHKVLSCLVDHTNGDGEIEIRDKALEYYKREYPEQVDGWELVAWHSGNGEIEKVYND